MNKTNVDTLRARGVKTLFFAQMFATLAYSVLYGSLVLYLTKGLHLSDITATGITASFIAFNYGLHLIGGYTGGRYLSYRLLFIIGMAFQFIGCVVLSTPTVNMMYWGLAAFLAGSGLNVTCINCMLTQLFEPADKRRESAFLWNYSGMNVGFFVGFALSGYFQLHGTYRELFLLSSLANLIALVIVVLNWSALGDRYTHLSESSKQQRLQKGLIGAAIVITLYLLLRLVLNYSMFSNNLVSVAGVIMIGVISLIALKQPTRIGKQKIFAFLILAITSVGFWSLYMLAPMALTLFFERNVDRHVMGILIAPQWIQNVNTLVIILGGPLMTVVFKSLRTKGYKITIPFQFSLSLMIVGLGFIVLPVGISFANSQGLSSSGWIVFSYVLQSIAELLISPIGYAMIGQLIPGKLQGIFMGTWMFASGVAATLSNLFSKMALGHSTSMSPLVTNASYSHTFNVLGWSALAIGVALLLFNRYLSMLTGERLTLSDASVPSIT